MRIRTPLGKVRGFGSAHDGTGHFWAQRVTAIVLLPLTIAFVCTVLAFNHAGQGEIVRQLHHPVTAILLVLFIGFSLWHACLGAQVVIDDYVHGWPRLALLVANTVFTVFIGAIAIFAVAKIAFGG